MTLSGFSLRSSAATKSIIRIFSKNRKSILLVILTLFFTLSFLPSTFWLQSSKSRRNSKCMLIPLSFGGIAHASLLFRLSQKDADVVYLHKLRTLFGLTHVPSSAFRGCLWTSDWGIFGSVVSRSWFRTPARLWPACLMPWSFRCGSRILDYGLRGVLSKDDGIKAWVSIFVRWIRQLRGLVANSYFVLIVSSGLCRYRVLRMNYMLETRNDSTDRQWIQYP